MGALVEKVVGWMYPSTPIPPLGLSPHRPLGMTVRILPRRKKFPTHGPWGRDVCKPAAGLTAMKRSATLAMVTQPDMLGWQKIRSVVRQRRRKNVGRQGSAPGSGGGQILQGRLLQSCQPQELRRHCGSACIVPSEVSCFFLLIFVF